MFCLNQILDLPLQMYLSVLSKRVESHSPLHQMSLPEFCCSPLGFESYNESPVNFKLMDTNGRELFNNTETLGGGVHQIRIFDVKNLTSGNFSAGVFRLFGTLAHVGIVF